MLKLIAIEPEKIAEIRNALQVITLSVKTLSIGDILCKVPKQVKKINRLLPQVKFEKGA